MAPSLIRELILSLQHILKHYYKIRINSVGNIGLESVWVEEKKKYTVDLIKNPAINLLIFFSRWHRFNSF